MISFETIVPTQNGDKPSKAFINRYHVESVKPFVFPNGETKNDTSVITTISGTQYIVKGNYAEISSELSRKDFSKK